MEPLTAEELDRYRREYSCLTEYHMRSEFKRLWDQLKAVNVEKDELPHVQTFQKLVTIYRLIWRQRNGDC